MKKGYTETMPKRSHDAIGMPIYGAPVDMHHVTRSEIQTVFGLVVLHVLVQQERDDLWVATVPALSQNVATATTKHGAIKAACDAASAGAHGQTGVAEQEDGRLNLARDRL